MAEGVLEKHLSEIEKAAARLQGVISDTGMIHSSYFSQELYIL